MSEVPITEVFQELPSLLEKYDVEPVGVLHVGAHRGEEHPAYENSGFKRITWVEPNPILAADLRSRGREVIEAAVSTVPGKATFYVTTQASFWSSLMKPIRRPFEEITVDTVRIDELSHGANVLVVDAQGGELDVLESADLSIFDLCIIEAGTQMEYEGQVSYQPVDEHMFSKGFELVSEHWHQHNMVICDRVYVRSDS